jgi:hypothetical protein
MLERYESIKEVLNAATQKEVRDHELHGILMTEAESDTISRLTAQLTKLQGVTLKLQEEGITLSEVRALFDAVLEKYPSMGEYIGPCGKIVHNVNFESGLVKLQDGLDPNPAECAALTRFEIGGSYNDITIEGQSQQTNDDNTDFVFNASKKRRINTSSNQKYLDCSFVPPTSNICERLFSTSKLTYSDQRKSLHPETLENILFLKANRSLWDPYVVCKALHKK